MLHQFIASSGWVSYLTSVV